MKNFDKAFEELIGIEGDYVNDSADRGGETKYGVSKRSYPDVDIKNLTLEGAKKIYYRDFWNHRYLRLENIPEYKIALEVFDTAVNMGQFVAGQIFQKSLNALNRNETDFPDIKEDGWIGDVTLAAYARVDKFIFLKVLNGYQFMCYAKIIENDPGQERFFNGWMKRV